MVPTLVENSLFLVHLLVNYFWKHYYDDYDWKTMIQGNLKGSMEPPPPPPPPPPLTIRQQITKKEIKPFS